MARDKQSLDVPLDEFQGYLNEAIELVLRRYRSLAEDPAYPAPDAAELAALFDESLPEQGMAVTALLDEVDAKVFDNATLNIGPKMFAYVMAGGNQVSVIADLLTSALNQNVAKWHLAPALTEVEKLVFRWMGKFIGLPHHRAGALVSGGSAANLTGLTIGRNVFFEQDDIRETGLFGCKPFTVYASVETHNSVDKSVQQLGIGRRQYRKIPVNSDCRIDIPALVARIEEDLAGGLRPFCLVGNAGTVNTGAIDPLDALADVAQRYGLWFHVDGCYGGLAASMPELREHYAGLARADSVALDFHKWLYQPFEIGCTLVRDWQTLRRSYFTPASYLDSGDEASGRININEHHFALSRNGKALKVWMSLKAYGAGAFREMIAKDIALTRYLAGQVDAAEDFALVPGGKLGIVCFRFLGREGEAADERNIDSLNVELIPALEADGRVFITGTRLFGRPVIRACTINHRTQRRDMDYLLVVIREVGNRLPRVFVESDL